MSRNLPKDAYKEIARHLSVKDATMLASSSRMARHGIDIQKKQQVKSHVRDVLLRSKWQKPEAGAFELENKIIFQKHIVITRIPIPNSKFIDGRWTVSAYFDTNGICQFDIVKFTDNEEYMIYSNSGTIELDGAAKTANFNIDLLKSFFKLVEKNAITTALKDVYAHK